MVRKIVQSKEPSLRQKSKPVAGIDKKVLDIIRDLKDTLAVQKEPEGVGLAAPQIGKNVRIFVCDYKDFQRVVVNPKVLEIGEIDKKPHSGMKTLRDKASRGKKEILEGCLSLPNYYGPLKRADKVTLKYLNEKGKEIEEAFEGFNAQIILHEIDHLEGVLFLDRLFEQKQPLYKVTGDEWEEVELG